MTLDTVRAPDKPPVCRHCWVAKPWGNPRRTTCAIKFSFGYSLDHGHRFTLPIGRVETGLAGA